MRKIFITILTIALLVPAFSIRADVASAVTYLKQQTQDDWITMALVATGETNVSKTNLQTFTGTLATDYAKRILGVVAVGENAATFTGADLVAGLKSKASGGQIGESDLLNDDAWGILALRAAGVPETDAVVAGSKAYLLQHQNSDGGWGYSITSSSDTNDTAAVLMALGEVETTSGAPVDSALTYLHSAQNSDGGFSYTPGSNSDSGSTAWVWSALQKLNQTSASWTKNSNTPGIFLGTLQLPDGSYKWQTGDASGSPSMTAFTVVALSGKYYPVLPPAGGGAAAISFRIEGSSSTLCQGQISTTTALQLIKDAASTCGYTYHIQTTSFGPYLDQIGQDAASGTKGWLYLVNYKQASVGAADYQLKAGDSVLWFFGEYTWQPLKLELSKRQVQVGESFTVTAKVYNNSSSVWQPQSGVALHGLSSNLTTDSNGQAVVTPTQSANLKLWGEDYALVRSAAVGVQVGSANSQSVNLDVTIDTTSPPPASSASFTVSANSLLLGNIKAGQAAEKQITLTNTSAIPLYFEASVSGDTVFNDYLKLNKQPWDTWQTSLNAAAQMPVAVRLEVPASVTYTGHKTGTLVFWAAPVNP